MLGGRVARTVRPWHAATQINSSSVMPLFLTCSRLMQQSSMDSDHHRHTPFHVTPGSTERALSVITKVLTAQYAGSFKKNKKGFNKNKNINTYHLACEIGTLD